ncbi:MAG: GatB/YqeY domain-containing protein [Patescibacteria group bacterium]
MSLKDDLMQQMKEAMRAKDAETLGTIRLLRSEIKNFEIDNGEQDDAGVQKIVARMIKQWKDAINDYKAGGREDLVVEAQQKLKVLEKFLPAQMSEEEVRKVVAEVVASAGDDAKPGPVTGMVMKKVAGKADGGLVARLVKELLA